MWGDHVFENYSQPQHIYHLANKNNIKENYETHQIQIFDFRLLMHL